MINKEYFKNFLNWFLIILIIIIIIVPYILLVVYLNKKDKKIVLYPTIKIIDIKNNNEPDVNEMANVVEVSKKILQKIRG